MVHSRRVFEIMLRLCPLWDHYICSQFYMDGATIIHTHSTYELKTQQVINKFSYFLFALGQNECRSYLKEYQCMQITKCKNLVHCQFSDHFPLLFKKSRNWCWLNWSAQNNEYIPSQCGKQAVGCIIYRYNTIYYICSHNTMDVLSKL